MREKTNTKENSTARVGGRVPWTVVAVEALRAYCLKVRFVDGTEGIVDASRMILGRNPGVFEALRDPAAFAKARVDYGAVTWPGELDLAPDAMYGEIKSNGRWVMEE